MTNQASWYTSVAILTSCEDVSTRGEEETNKPETSSLLSSSNHKSSYSLSQSWNGQTSNFSVTIKPLSLLSHALTRMKSKDDLGRHQNHSNIVYHAMQCNGSRATHRRMQTLRFVLRSPERVVWAEEGVVGAEVEVVTGLRALLLLGYGRQNLKQNFSLLKITPFKPFFFLYTASNTKLGINCDISNLKNIVLWCLALPWNRAGADRGPE